MIAVTLGMGKYEALAEWSAEVMEKRTGLRSVVLKGVEAEPHWWKCKLFDLLEEKGEHPDEVLYFDADVCSLRSWNPEKGFKEANRAFCAVAEPNSSWILKECREYGLPEKDWYLNSGVLMFGREHQKIWDLTWEKRPKFGRFYEQTALNRAILDSGMRLEHMGRRFNALAFEGEFDEGRAGVSLEKVVNIHVVYSGEPETRLARLKHYKRLVDEWKSANIPARK